MSSLKMKPPAVRTTPRRAQEKPRDLFDTLDVELAFAFADAGIVGRDNFNTQHSTDGPPPEPNQLSIDINLKAVVTTGYLAQHYSGNHLERERARSWL